MKIHYQDEYGEIVYVAYNKNAVPRIGETVTIQDEDYRVKNVTWPAEHDDVVVLITQGMVRSQEPIDDSSGRLTEMNRAILAVSKRQDAMEKKNRMLGEQVGTIRKHINQRIIQERKDQ